ncbi:MAG: RdgB/HAM1 family non-canonical purine NTP pyrophosphatase [Omnitrophica bacterium]|nr:RdgB/HAM1 family non-canonical purine NTP pyrophosphatase [Candidatus Omnitrophota bacterium]
MRLIIATKNNHKLREIRKILKGISLPTVSLAALDKKFRIVENGKTFLENSLKKSIPVSRAYPQDYVLGEDSGLEVDFLRGAPGIYSKRYSGRNSTTEKNNTKLLRALKDVGVKKRGAHFICCLSLARNGKLIEVFQGKLRGRISTKAIGANGFGYDPVLYLPRYKKTVAQLPLSLKNRISHRAKAFKKLKTHLKNCRL